ncbi:MAG: DUF1015 domain-containing protein [Firmicutes bacterium]|nr:DUF1015 domain-containing protein [Bacillota bacterium]
MKTLPFKFGPILLPKEGIDMDKWAVVACDQYTSQPEYWKELEKHVEGHPSTLNIIYPEVYLEEENPQKRIEDIISNMNECVSEGLFQEIENGLILIERTYPNGIKRKGLTMLVDLTQYSFKPEDKALIRATEGTVIERIPPRVEIRKNCPLELPHILVLIDDEKKTVIEPLFKNLAKHKLVYDSKLNMNGGHIKGWNVAKEKFEDKIENALIKLLKKSVKKYGEEFLFAVGDGNHSLATAKACYDESNPLSKYALVEIENIYDEGIIFEPIHRVVFVENKELFIEKLKGIGGTDTAKLFVGDKIEEINLPKNAIEGVDKVQVLIDEYLKEHGGKVDYIHGENDLKEICAKENGIGIVLKSMQKDELFEFVVKNGVLPRKTFSMGEANEKRYYIEARKIK